MKRSYIGLVALAAVLIAGCGGGSDKREKELEEKVSTLEKEVEDLEKRPTESEAAARERTAEQRGRQAGEAEGNRRAEAAEQEAEEAKEELQKAEQEAQGKADQLRQNNARRVLEGLRPNQAASPVTPGNVAVTPRFRATALVTPDPAFSTPTTTPGSNGKWFITSITDSDFTTTDRLDVYSDVEAPKRISFRESDYNNGVADNAIINTDELGVAALYNPSDSIPSIVVASDKKVVGSVLISTGTNDHTRVSGVIASAFPKSTEPERTFAVVDRGSYPKMLIDAAREWYQDATTQQRQDGVDGDTVTKPDHCTPSCDSRGFPTADATEDNPKTVRDDKRYPLRWTYETSGSLAGASGTFTCASGTGIGATKPGPNDCGVTNQNTHFNFNGPWVFTPSAGAQIRVDDTEYMYFGWWARQTNPNDIDGAWTFRTFHGSATGGNRSTEAEIARLSGTATYKGVAAGYYSFFAPLDSSSDYGEFTATATLTANFTETDDDSLGGDETVSGTIDNFTTRNGNRVNRPDWTVTLKQTDIIGTRTGNFGGGAGGAGVEAMRNLTANQGPVSWKIKDEAVSAPDSGQWEAAFYSNLPANKRGGDDPAVNQEDATPAGIAGTFEAEYHAVGKMVGAFGAHKQ